MSDFKPHTGAIIDRLSRPEPLTESEQRFADWAQERGLAVMFSKCYPLEGEEDFEAFLTRELGMEELIDGLLYAQFLSLSEDVLLYPEMWPLQEELLRAAFERTKMQQGASLPAS